MRRLPELEAERISVPMSVGYVIIRVGEWTMVMLGETVLSLLGVPLQFDLMVYGMFVCSMLTACSLQFQGYSIHPIHAEHHVLHGGQFSFKGLLYLIWATIWYATILVCVGTGAKVLTKKALYFEIYEGANWVFCGGLAAAFVSIMAFEALHHSRGDVDGKGLGLFDCFVVSFNDGRKGLSSFGGSFYDGGPSSPTAASFRGGLKRSLSTWLSVRGRSGNQDDDEIDDEMDRSRGDSGGSSSCFGKQKFSKAAVRADLVKAATVLAHIGLAAADLKPHLTVVSEKNLCGHCDQYNRETIMMREGQSVSQCVLYYWPTGQTHL
jgi:hypothetical protein